MLRSVAALGLLISIVGIAGCGSSGDSSADSAAERIAPEGAPYSYAVPDGFEVGEPTFPGKEPRFLTSAVPEGSEKEGYVGAFEWALGAVERGYSGRQLLDWLDEQTRSFYRSEGARISAGTETRVAGHPAVCWKIDDFKNQYEGVIDADSCVIVSGHTVVSQSCSWKPTTRAEIQRGCTELRASLELS